MIYLIPDIERYKTQPGDISSIHEKKHLYQNEVYRAFLRCSDAMLLQKLYNVILTIITTSTYLPIHRKTKVINFVYLTLPIYDFLSPSLVNNHKFLSCIVK